MTINLLPEKIINQIAAGEVIENPSAVIKELVENSIDAGASQIDIEIEESGIKKIQIKDNGCGISKNDLLKAPLRHATSKIKNFNDLYSIKTMGFRGEALASIFSIAKTKIVSKCSGKEAFEISSKNVSKVKESACQKGTIILVEDLFYNTPARKKYLKSANMELKAIIDIMKRFELSCFNIKLSLKHNGKILINKPVFKNIEENIYYVLGKDLKGKLVEISKKNKGIKLSGFIGNPVEVTYSFRKNQMIYVNSRFVKSKLIKDAIYGGFGSNLMVGRHPFFILFIDIDPEIIDVNIHPSKIELKFENELEIFELVKKTIEEAFEKNSLFKKFNREEKSNEKNIKLHKISDEIKEVKVEKKKKEKNYFTRESQKDLSDKNFENLNIKKELIAVEEDKIQEENTENEGYFEIKEKEEFIVNEDDENYLKLENYKEDENIGRDIERNIGIKGNVDDNIKKDMILVDQHVAVENNSNSNDKNIPKEIRGPLYDELSEYRLIGQVDKTYILISTKKDMILVDQHVAEEKYFYEEFKRELKGKKAEVQKLLKAQLIHLDNSEMLMFKENKKILESIGFEIEIFGNNEIMVRAVPINIRKKIIDAEKVKDFLYEILINKDIRCVEEEKNSKIASMACRMAVMAGDELTIPQMRKMIDNLRSLKQPFNCPHGRPTFLKYSFKDLEKKFKRVL